MKQEPFVIERSYDAPVEKVWKAITDREQMKQWYFDIAEFKPEPGFEFTFKGENEGRVFVHLCKIIEVIPLKKLKHTWTYEGLEGVSYVIFELFAEGERTRLKLTHEGLESFPQDRDFRRENFVAGWTYITGTSLKDYLEKTKIKKEITIAATPDKIWNVLVDHSTIKQWAAQFSEGTYVETDWQKDSDVIWRDKEGKIGAKGKVVETEAPGKLKVMFYDDPNAADGTPLGTYAEHYTITGHDSNSVLSIEAGPLPHKEAEPMTSMWDKALAKMKELAEG
jgi:uncharacterized protein YndB with AHSA1/START domain